MLRSHYGFIWIILTELTLLTDWPSDWLMAGQTNWLVGLIGMRFGGKYWPGQSKQLLPFTKGYSVKPNTMVLSKCILVQSQSPNVQVLRATISVILIKTLKCRSGNGKWLYRGEDQSTGETLSEFVEKFLPLINVLCFCCSWKVHSFTHRQLLLVLLLPRPRPPSTPT